MPPGSAKPSSRAATLDAAPLCSRLIENSAERRDLDRQVVVLDHRSGPHGLHDLVFRDQLSVAFDQQPGEIERPRTQQNRRCGPRGIQPKEAEAIEAKPSHRKTSPGPNWCMRWFSGTFVPPVIENPAPVCA
jgi:hypothetical protein